jgi:hypothetical protein
MDLVVWGLGHHRGTAIVSQSGRGLLLKWSNNNRSRAAQSQSCHERPGGLSGHHARLCR